MVIFIKSFNRPFYLDRCLHSIGKFVRGEKKIIVLDDGTDSRYLDKITSKYPEVTILRSEFADEKAEKIRNHHQNNVPVEGLKLPSRFWRESIFANAGKYFLLLEDDMWFTQSFDLAQAQEVINRENIALLKLTHFGNPRLISGQRIQLNENLTEIVPDLPVADPGLFKNLMIKNPLKIFSVLIKLGLVDRLIKIRYYTIYNVAGCIFSRDYYHFLWEDVPEKVNEDLQLVKAVQYLRDHKPRYAATSDDVLLTSFSSSATNMFADIDFDVFRFSHLLNENWLSGKFDSTADLSGDIPEKEIFELISRDGRLKVEEWQKWKEVFKKQYLDVGHKL